MIARLVTDAIRDYIQTNAPAAFAAYVVQDESETKARPLLIVQETGSVEHEVLRGVYEIEVTVTIETNPTDTTADEAGVIADGVYGVIGDVETITTTLNSTAGITCWDVRLGDQQNEPDDGIRSASMTLSVVAANN